MQIISSSTGPISNGSTPSEDRDLTSYFTGEGATDEAIKKASSVPLLKIFNYYKLNIDSINRKCSCPFLKHKNGKESTASFYFYPETNTFWCFGCKTGTTVVDFVANIERINKFQAALKVIRLFNNDIDDSAVTLEINSSFKEKTDLLFSFSKEMRDLISEGHSYESLEEIYKIFDKMNDKYELDVEAIKSLIDKLKLRINNIL